MSERWDSATIAAKARQVSRELDELVGVCRDAIANDRVSVLLAAATMCDRIALDESNRAQSLDMIRGSRPARRQPEDEG
jgi:hypothetical protein